MSDSTHSTFRRRYKLVVLGSGGVGKSSLTIQYLRSRFVDDYDPTIEDSYVKYAVVDGEDIIMDILDTAGQEEYSALREQYMRTGEGFLLVYSITSRDSFKEIHHFHQQILRVKDAAIIPMIIVGNKRDLSKERQVGEDEGHELGRALKCPMTETSAKLGLRVDDVFHALVQLIRRYNKLQQSFRRSLLVNLPTTILAQKTEGAGKRDDLGTRPCCGCVIA